MESEKRCYSELTYLLFNKECLYNSTPRKKSVYVSLVVANV